MMPKVTTNSNKLHKYMNSYLLYQILNENSREENACKEK